MAFKTHPLPSSVAVERNNTLTTNKSCMIECNPPPPRLPCHGHSKTTSRSKTFLVTKYKERLRALVKNCLTSEVGSTSLKVPMLIAHTQPTHRHVNTYHEFASNGTCRDHMVLVLISTCPYLFCTLPALHAVGFVSAFHVRPRAICYSSSLPISTFF